MPASRRFSTSRLTQPTVSARLPVRHEHLDMRHCRAGRATPHSPPWIPTRAAPATEATPRARVVHRRATPIDGSQPKQSSPTHELQAQRVRLAASSLRRPVVHKIMHLSDAGRALTAHSLHRGADRVHLHSGTNPRIICDMTDDTVIDDLPSGGAQRTTRARLLMARQPNVRPRASPFQQRWHTIRSTEE